MMPRAVHPLVRTDTEVAQLLALLVFLADGEGLLRADDHRGPALDRLAESGLVLPYIGTTARRRFVYVVGLERERQGGSALPPPSIQNGATLRAYERRDDGICHLCGGSVGRDWRNPQAWPSLDHLRPRSLGGSNYPSNLKTSHTSCNKARRDRPVSAFAGSPLTRHGR